MILSDRDIQQALAKGELRIDPAPQAAQYSPSAVDLLLGDEPLKEWDPSIVGQSGVEQIIDPEGIKFRDLAERFLKELPRQPDGSFIVPPRKFVLAITHETVDFPLKGKLAARVEGRSSIARLGLTVHITAPTIHCGFRGRITLEMFNLGPFNLRLRPGKTRICQLIIERVTSVPRSGLKSAFVGQRSVTGRR